MLRTQQGINWKHLSHSHQLAASSPQAIFLQQAKSLPSENVQGCCQGHLIALILNGLLRIPVVTLPGGMEVECHHSPQFTATLLNEQDSLKTARQKSDHSGPTVGGLFGKHPGQLQHSAQQGQLQFEKHFNADTRKVVVTCHWKQTCQKDLVIIGVLILGVVHTHPLIPPMLPQNHPSSTNQALINRAEAGDPMSKKQCNTATLHAIHHHQEEHLKMLRNELQNLPPPDKLVFQRTPIHAIRTKTERKSWHQRLCHFSPAITAHAHK